MAPLGLRGYTVIMSCPILSHISVADLNSFIMGKQSSGLMVVQTDDADKFMYLNFFFGLNFDGTLPVHTTEAIESVYGITGDINLDGFVYSSSIKLSIVAPAANLVGTYYAGKCRLGTSSYTGAVSSGWKLSKLIQ
jgi:hypothetical protein